MNSEEQFDQLARRDEELHALASRGRWRSLVIMILAFVPAPFLVMVANDDRSLLGVLPVGVACVVAASYSWTKWQRRPEDSQFVAFVGLDRRRQWATYRSMRNGTGIDDPVVLTIVESIHHHLRRSLPAVVATMVVIAAMVVALVGRRQWRQLLGACSVFDGGWRSHRRTSLGHQSSRSRHRPQPSALTRAQLSDPATSARRDVAVVKLPCEHRSPSADIFAAQMAVDAGSLPAASITNGSTEPLRAIGTARFELATPCSQRTFGGRRWS